MKEKIASLFQYLAHNRGLQYYCNDNEDYGGQKQQIITYLLGNLMVGTFICIWNGLLQDT